MSQFHDVRFPEIIGRGARGGPRRRTEVVTLGSGFEERNANWARSRREYDVSYGVRTADDLDGLVQFFEARNGRLFGFRFKDWADYKSCPPSAVPGPLNQLLGDGDGIRTVFALRKRYGTEAISYWRQITRPVTGSVRIALADAEQFSGWTVDIATGLITFGTAPGVDVKVYAGFEFDVPCRFDTDMLDVVLEHERVGTVPSIPLIELRA